MVRHFHVRHFQRPRLDNHALTPFPHDPDRGRGKGRKVVRVTVDVNGVNVIM